MITSAAPETGVAPGTRFTGTLTYDPAEKPTGGLGFEGFGQLEYGTAGWEPNPVADSSGLTVRVGGHPVYSGQGGMTLAVSEIAYQNQYGYNSPPYTRIVISNSSNDQPSTVAALTLTNPSQDVLNPHAAPGPQDVLNPQAVPIPLNLADFPSAQLNVFADSGSPQTHTLYSGTIDTLTPVPEPTPLASFLLALCGMALRRRLRTVGRQVV